MKLLDGLLCVAVGYAIAKQTTKKVVPPPPVPCDCPDCKQPDRPQPMGAAVCGVKISY
jgi:hypothetical protein